MEKKNKGNENKVTLGDFNCTMDKLAGMVEIKHKELIDVVPIMPCQNSSWIMGSRIYGEGRTQIPLNSPTIIDTLAKVQDSQGLY